MRLDRAARRAGLRLFGPAQVGGVQARTLGRLGDHAARPGARRLHAARLHAARRPSGAVTAPPGEAVHGTNSQTIPTIATRLSTVSLRLVARRSRRLKNRT